MPVLPEVASTIVVRPGSIRPSASAASIIATPILSFTLPAGLCDSSLPISSAPQSGAPPPPRWAGFGGMARETAFCTQGRLAAASSSEPLARQPVGRRERGGAARLSLGEDGAHRALDAVDAA